MMMPRETTAAVTRHSTPQRPHQQAYVSPLRASGSPRPRLTPHHIGTGTSPSQQRWSESRGQEWLKLPPRGAPSSPLGLGSVRLAGGPSNGLPSAATASKYRAPPPPPLTLTPGGDLRLLALPAELIAIQATPPRVPAAAWADTAATERKALLLDAAGPADAADVREDITLDKSITSWDEWRWQQSGQPGWY